MRDRRVPALLLVLLTLVAPALPLAGAAEPAQLTWEYRVHVDDPASGVVRAEVRFSGLKDVIDSFTFRTAAHPYPVLDVSSTTSELEPVEGGVKLKVRGDTESFTFKVDVRRQALGGHGADGEHRAEGYSSFVGPEFGVFKAEALALGFTYTYYEGRPFEWQSRVAFTLPDGWSVEAPWKRDGDAAFRLPKGETLPRGYVAMGSFRATDAWEAHGREFRYVRLGNATDYDADLKDYLVAATPYYEGVYGPSTGRVILVVSASDPMFTGGLGGADSFYVHEDAQLRTVAHEYAHVWQLFGTQATPGDATTWLNEGDADYHSALSLLATGWWSPKQVNDFLREPLEKRYDAPFAGTSLANATYGATRDVAYGKGALVVHAIDGVLARETDGARGVADLLQTLNARHDPRVRDSDPDAAQARRAHVTNAEVLDVLAEVAHLDFEPFFRQFVYGTGWPRFEEVIPADGIVLTNLTLEPAAVPEGAPVTATLSLVNRGLEAGERRLVLTVDGDAAEVRTVALAVGEARKLTFNLTAPAAGTHELAVDYLTTELRVLTPADLRLERVRVLPERPVAGEPAQMLVYLRNDGELPGTVPLTLLLDDAQVHSGMSPTIAGGVRQAITVPIVFPAEGPTHVEARLGSADDANAFKSALTIHVQPPDRDGDGIPDAEDAYPDNPKLTEQSIGNDVLNRVPAPAAALTLVALLAAAARKLRA